MVRQLDEWIKAHVNVAAFLALRELVKERLDDGYSATVIFAYRRDTKRIDVCYDTFLKYVHRHLRPPRPRLKAPVADTEKKSVRWL